MESRDMEKLLKALANRRRIEIVKFLKRNKFATVGEVAGAIRLSIKATSKHLLILDKVDIVERGQQSIFAHYRIANKQHPLVTNIFSSL